MKLKNIFIIIFFIFSFSYAESLTVADAVRSSLISYPGIKAIQAKYAAAKAQEEYAYSFLWPNISLGASYGNLRNEEYSHVYGDLKTSLQTVNDDVIHNTKVGLTLTMPLFAAGIWQGTKINTIYKDLAGLELDKTENETVFNTINYYYQLYLARKNVSLLEERRKALTEDYNSVSSRYEAKMVQRTDVLRSEIQLRSLEMDLENARKNLILAEQNFSYYIPSVNPTTVELTIDTVPTAAQLPDLEYLKKEMRENRPEYKTFEQNQELALQNYNLAKSDLYPTVQLIGTNSWARYNMPDLNYEQGNWTAMLQANWTLFSGLGRFKNMDNKWQSYQNILKAMEVADQGCELELRDAYLSVKQAIDQLKNARKIKDLAVENYYQVRARYQSGMDTSFSYIDANNTLLSAQLGLISAETTALTAMAKLEKVTGVLAKKYKEREA